MIIHNIAPVYDENSEILILGSFPSVISRAEKFFYANKQNRFWRVLAAVYECDVPQTVTEKKQMLVKNHVALWDVIASCEIEGSSDSTIKNAAANDISGMLGTSEIKRIYCNGSTAYAMYLRYIYEETQILPVKLPSTSSANASYSFDSLVRSWGEIRCGKE